MDDIGAIVFTQCDTMRFNIGWWWFSIAFLIGTMMITMVMSCPASCSCKWKSGKQWVECANRNLTRLPEGAPDETQVLDLTGNHIVKLPPKCFQLLGLTNLQKLYLSKSNISQIVTETFVGLVGLVDLDLSNNQILDVPTDTFPSCRALMRLILNLNPIRNLYRDAFKPLSQLTTLEMKKCQLVSIESGAFNGLQSLEWLGLDGNLLTYIPDMTLPLGGNLHGLTLHNNPWVCDCRLRAVQAWLKESASVAPQEYQPVCHAPLKLRDKQIKEVKLDDLACLPQVTVDDEMLVEENANVTLQCSVYAVPMAIVSWWFNGEKCDTQTENDSFIISTLPLIRYVCKQRGQFNLTNVLHIYGADRTDEGVFTCIAENTAGSVEANLSLRVRFQERSTVEPAFDNPGTGYVAAVAAGALVGTLLALGCVIGSVIFCTKRRRNQKRNAKTLASQSKIVTPVAKENDTSHKGETGSLNIDQQQQQMMYGGREVGRTSSLDRRETVSAYRSPVPKYLTEPDLINEVYPSTNLQENGGSYNLYQRQITEPRQILDYGEARYSLQPSTIDPRPSLSQLSYLDHDGYPLNFGLPKISFNANCTLPRLRQRIPEGSAVAPPARYSREAEFLARSTAYNANVMPRSEARYTIDGYPYPVSHQPITSPVRQPLQIPPIVSPISPLSPGISLPVDVPFIPSPPAAYRGEPTPLSPRSLMSKTAREAAAAVAARAAGVHPPEHPESPDEGYVGDAMDV